MPMKRPMHLVQQARDFAFSSLDGGDPHDDEKTKREGGRALKYKPGHQRPEVANAGLTDDIVLYGFLEQ